MSAVSSSPNPDARRRLTQRQVFIAKMAAIIVAAVVAIGLAIFFRERSEEPTMTVVVRNVRTTMTLTGPQAAARTVDGIAFPDWSKQGWTPTGGRTDAVGHGRVADTTLYANGGRAVTLTIVSGTGSVDNGKRAGGRQVPITRNGHTVDATYFGFGANVLSDSAMYIFKRTVNGRTVILTGTPVSTALYTAMTNLLVTGLDPWNGAAPTTP